MSKITSIDRLDMEFDRLFPEEDACMAYLDQMKWRTGFICRHCGNTNFCKGSRKFSRRCTKCKKTESVTAHTVFHRCRLPLIEAFRMAFTVCQEPGISSYALSRMTQTRQMTCWKLKKRIEECKMSETDFGSFFLHNVNRE
ncbi:MAG: transposase [Bacteroidales bacterium]|jgi:hypothetical protein|nr:transposase [Bacteroidales bacterium]